MKHPLRASLSLVSCLGTLALLISPVLAQVNGPGPSPSNLFDTVLNLPGDEAIISGASGESIGGAPDQTTQLNVMDNGIVGNSFSAFSVSEVNISGGLVGFDLVASESEVNISGGFVFSRFDVNSSVVNISGGEVIRCLDVFGGSVVNISGGTVGNDLDASGSVLNISGGEVGRFLDAFDGSVVNISGGEVGGWATAHSGSEVNISGGSVGCSFNAFPGSEVNISGGEVGSGFDAASEVNISGGVFGDDFAALNGSEVNISGGIIGDNFDVSSGAQVNFFGSQFFIDGVELDPLLLGHAFTITDRDVTLSGLLVDGQSFSFDLNSFDPDATVTVTISNSVLLGDVNQDGVVDFFDIQPFIEVLSAQTFQNEADIDGNGVVDFFDIQPFIDILSGP